MTLMYLVQSSITFLSEMQTWQAVALGSAMYTFYYLVQVVKRPILACPKGPFKNFLQKELPTLDMKFWPTFWCVESRAQTVFASFIRAQTLPTVNYRREILPLADGGEVALDWLDEGCADDAPCVLILPGLTGESQAEYIKCLVLASNEIGIRVVVFNNRGLGGIALKTQRLYCASNTEDLIEVINHVRKTLPHCKLGAAGISMGGLVLGNYLARQGLEANKYLTAAKIISVPWNVHKGVVSIEKPIINSFMCRHLASNLNRIVSNCEIYKNSDIDMAALAACRTIREFDSLFTSKQFGYAHVDDYYTDATLHNKLDGITVPLLCLSAADDPFQPGHAIPIEAAENSTHVAIIVTERGGHIGFLEGCWPSPRKQYMGRLFAEFFSKALFDENGEFSRVAAEMRSEYMAKNPSCVKLEEDTKSSTLLNCSEA